MAERSILFRPEMALAIEQRRKWQTRRLVKPQPTHRLIEGMGHITVGMDPADDGAVWYDADCINPGREVRCPYGRVGDRLRVLTTWAVVKTWDGYRPMTISRNIGWFWHAGMGPKPETFGKSRPGRFCPSFLRHFLPLIELTDIRPQKLLEDMTEEDAIAEGIERHDSNTSRITWKDYSGLATPDGWEGWLMAVNSYRSLWDIINPKYCFDSNPWVWAFSFKRI